jgi:F0F1-type ATP synthase epsilon subunit
MALGYGICKMTPFRAKAKYIAIATGAVELITNRISISAKCISKVASMPDSNLKERLREAKLYSNTSRRYSFLIIQNILSNSVARIYLAFVENRFDFCL